MTQEFKNIEEIKNDIIQQTLTNGVGELEEFTTEVAKRFAQQYIDENKELVEMLERIVDAQFNPNKSLASLNMAIADAKELIAKHTTHDKGKEETR